MKEVRNRKKKTDPKNKDNQKKANMTIQEKILHLKLLFQNYPKKVQESLNLIKKNLINNSKILTRKSMKYMKKK